jgi:hypothetical protein
MTIVYVPYEGGPLQYRDGEQQFEEYDTATDQLVAGEAIDINPNVLDAHEPDVIERYVLAKDGRRWVLRYDGRHERVLAPGEQPRRVAVDVTTRVADGPSQGGIVAIVDFDASDLERYNSLAYKKTRFGDRNAAGYTLRETPEGWRWFWTRQETTMTDRIDTARLEQIEGQLADDVLTDDELATALHEAGLPELARVVARFARQGQR